MSPLILGSVGRPEGSPKFTGSFAGKPEKAGIRGITIYKIA
jgi:hypothetical protein